MYDTRRYGLLPRTGHFSYSTGRCLRRVRFGNSTTIVECSKSKCASVPTGLSVYYYDVRCFYVRRHHHLPGRRRFVGIKYVQCHCAYDSVIRAYVGRCNSYVFEHASFLIIRFCFYFRSHSIDETFSAARRVYDQKYTSVRRRYFDYDGG